jgi:Uma2 family endonuclease
MPWKRCGHDVRILPVAGATMYDGRTENVMQGAQDRRLTYDDFLLFPDDGLRHEIIDGEHYVTPSLNTRHQLLVGRLYFEIETFLRAHPGTGQVFVAPFDVLFTKWDVVEPDLLFIAADQNGILTDKNVQGAPALVIEILSPGTRKTDEHAKRVLFDRGGVREYWMVDPDTAAVRVCRRHGDGSFPLDAEGNSKDVLTTPLLAGLEIRLADLFA